MRYVSRVPKQVPAGQVVVHNHVKWPGPGTPIGLNGFRAWTQQPDETGPLEPCNCGWAPELTGHYRVVETWREVARARRRGWYLGW